MIPMIPTKSHPWDAPTLTAAIFAAQEHTRGQAILQMALMEYALCDDAERAGSLVDRIADPAHPNPPVIQEIKALLEAHHQLQQPEPPQPERQPEPGEIPGHPGWFKAPQPCHQPDLRAEEEAKTPASKKSYERRPWRDPAWQQPAIAKPTSYSPHLPPFRQPPLKSDIGTREQRLSLRRWEEMGVIPNALHPAPATISAVFIRLFGVGPPMARDRRSAKGYTRRELHLIRQALQTHRNF